MGFSQSDIEFFQENNQYRGILTELFGEIILDDFHSSGNSEVSAKVVARKVKSFQEALGFELCIPEEIHPNFRNLIETELQL